MENSTIQLNTGQAPLSSFVTPSPIDAGDVTSLAKQSELFAIHRRIMHGEKGYGYFCGKWSYYCARQVTPVTEDVTPNRQNGVYYNVYAQGVIPEKRGEAKDVVGAGGIYAEFDAKDFITIDEARPFYVELKPGEKHDPWVKARVAWQTASKENYQEAQARAWAAVQSMQVPPPSAIVSSGGGYHCYWYFNAFLPFDREGANDKFAAALKAWVTLLGADESAKDIARILRVPGTLNDKEHYIALFGAPLPVHFIEFHPERRYIVADLIALLPKGWNSEVQQEQKRKARKHVGGRPAPVWTSALPDCVEVRRYNKTHKIEDALESSGATPDSQSRTRWIAAQSTSGESSIQVNVKANHAWHYSSNNAIGREGKAYPADYLLMTQFDGDVDACMRFLKGEAVVDAPDFDGVKLFAKWGDIEPFVRARKMEIAEEAQKAAEAAARAFADNPIDEYESAAIAAQKQAEKALRAACAIGYPTEGADRQVMTAILELFSDAWEKHGVTEVYLSNVRLAREANKGRDTIIATIERLLGWFIIRTAKEDKRAARYMLSPNAFAQARKLSEAPLLSSRVTAFLHDCDTPFQSCRNSVTQLDDNKCDIWAEYYSHDAFTLPMTPRADTPEERVRAWATALMIRTGGFHPYSQKDVDSGNRYAIAAHEAAIKKFGSDHAQRLLDRFSDSDANVGDLDTDTPQVEIDDSWRARLAAGYLTKEERRFHAQLSSLSARHLLLLDYLHALGGTATGAQLCDLLRVKKQRMTELLRKLLTLGIIEKADRYSVCFAPDWRDRIDQTVTQMPTFGSKALRAVQHIDASIAYQNHRQEEAKELLQSASDPAEVERLEMRISATDSTLATRHAERMEIEGWVIEQGEAGALPPVMVNKIRRIYGREDEGAKAAAVEYLKEKLERAFDALEEVQGGELEAIVAVENHVDATVREIEALENGASVARTLRTQAPVLDAESATYRYRSSGAGLRDHSRTKAAQGALRRYLNQGLSIAQADSMLRGEGFSSATISSAIELNKQGVYLHE